MATSSKSTGNCFKELSKYKIAEALERRGAVAEPLKIRSSPFLPRKLLNDCSPKTQRKESATFDLPAPFGPTIAVMGRAKSKRVCLANDLNPESSRLFKRKSIFSLPILFVQSGFGRVLFRFLLGRAFARSHQVFSKMHAHYKMLVVVRPPFFKHFVRRSDARDLLGFFLKTAFRVLKKLVFKHVFGFGQEIFFNERFGFVITAVKVQSPGQGLKRVRKNKDARPAGVLGLSAQKH